MFIWLIISLSPHLLDFEHLDIYKDKHNDIHAYQTPLDIYNDLGTGCSHKGSEEKVSVD